jgi:hypothetical protein
MITVLPLDALPPPEPSAGPWVVGLLVVAALAAVVIAVLRRRRK